MFKRITILVFTVLMLCSCRNYYDNNYAAKMAWIKSMPCTLEKVDEELVYVIKESDLISLSNDLNSSLTPDQYYIKPLLATMHDRIREINTFYYEWKQKEKIYTHFDGVPPMPEDFHPIIIIYDGD
ncbi:hypothetical protein M0R19_05845 [Candidatus Pacearchaeota archaeon]|jgi:hypothetical protein|nr:hypothetical protein [Candidatus Pacearchaeota archaeon]